MQASDISPLQRLVLAFYAFFAILFRSDVALAVYRVREARRGGALPPSPGPGEGAEPERRPPAPSAAPPIAAAPPPAGAVKVPPAEAAREAKAPEPPKPAAPPKPVGPAAAAAAPAAKPAEPAGAPAPKAVPAPVEPPKPAPAPVPAPVPAAPAKPDPRPALQLLSLLQREGRLVDFIEEDLAGFPDASIGAAARTVHAGCKRAIEEYFRLEPIFREAEGASITVQRGFDPAAIRLTGNVIGEPPFKGALRHHGWRAKEVKLPPVKDATDPTLVAPAEVELG